ncbi:uncharacterized protein LOC144103635 [Amblyomma americanum]
MSGHTLRFSHIHPDWPSARYSRGTAVAPDCNVRGLACVDRKWGAPAATAPMLKSLRIVTLEGRRSSCSPIASSPWSGDMTANTENKALTTPASTALQVSSHHVCMRGTCTPLGKALRRISSYHQGDLTPKASRPSAQVRLSVCTAPHGSPPAAWWFRSKHHWLRRRQRAPPSWRCTGIEDAGTQHAQLRQGIAAVLMLLLLTCGSEVDSLVAQSVPGMPWTGALGDGDT